MTWYYSERSNRKIVHDDLITEPKAHLRQTTELPEPFDVENKVISQNNIQKIANIVILHGVLFIELVS